MIDTRKIKQHIRQILSYQVAIGISIGLLFPIVSWMIDLINQQIPFSIVNLVKIHSINPIHFIIDIIPLIIGIGVHQFVRQKKEIEQSYSGQLEQKEHEINKNAEFAKRIGEGDYEAEFELYGDEDILGKSLVLMRDNLLSNYQKEAEDNWISEGKDLIADILRLHNNLDDLAYDVIVNLINYIDVIQGAIYIYDDEQEILKNIATYAYNRKKYINQEFKIGYGLIGECAYEKKYIYRTEIPEDYATITSGILGDQKPRSILIVPLITDEKLQGVIEFASLENQIPELTINYLRELGEIIARTIFNLKVRAIISPNSRR